MLHVQIEMCCSVLQYRKKRDRERELSIEAVIIFLYCSVLQYVAVCGRVVQCIAVWCSVLHHVALPQKFRS